jgi:hypothetical protein
MLRIASEACLDRGGDPERLRQWALTESWTPAPEAELTKHATPYTAMIGGWTFTRGATAFAVMQSQLRPPHSGYVCSVTSTLSSEEDHNRLKSEFSRLFGSPISEEHESASGHTDRYWIDRAREPPIKTTLAYLRASRAITIRMIHSRAHPTQS